MDVPSPILASPPPDSSASVDLGALLRQRLGEPPAAVQALIDASRPRELAAGEALVRAGERWTALFVVAQGALRLYYLDRNGKASNKNFHLAGAMFWPITPALAQRPVDFWIEAVTPCRTWVLDWAPWQAACADWPAWAMLERRALAALLDDKMAREQQFLQCTATERYQRLCADHPDWLGPIPLRHLASYLGITDVALSRIRRRLNRG